ncbi:GNAT family N-acetyltransferase [Rodentibacter myodis]|uniref:GNAT family N-acetyltransferase n=1 Tax=Rodentibacter myodis TaxID=1907939 RepID=A0A1V3JN08_9PAST|nr:GNAT family N-acetyltransferase [Rodentibacter myodis]OOF58028.1 GNAT family N-acetyltransferase [Rodentibacter myodis]
MELRRPTLQDQNAVIEMMDEFISYQSKHDSGFWDKNQFDYLTWLQNNQDAEQGRNLPENFVPAVQLVSFDETGRALGFLQIRLQLNDFLRQQGGHIGYSIRPSERRKGYAKVQLHLALPIARSLKLEQVLITCHCDNAASRAVILANSGVLETISKGIERYWIDLKAIS